MSKPQDWVKIYERNKLLIDVEIKGKGYHSRYDAVFTLEAKRDAKFPSLDDLKRYVDELAKRYPERGFTLTTITLAPGRINPVRRVWNFLVNLVLRVFLRRKPKPKAEAKTLYVVTQRDAIQKKDAITLAFDLDKRAVYIHRADMEKPKALVNYLIFRSLGSLGLVKSKYRSTVGRSKA